MIRKFQEKISALYARKIPEGYSITIWPGIDKNFNEEYWGWQIDTPSNMHIQHSCRYPKSPNAALREAMREIRVHQSHETHMCQKERRYP